MGGITDAIGDFFTDTLGSTVGKIVGTILSPFTLGVGYLEDLVTGWISPSPESVEQQQRGLLLNARGGIEPWVAAYGRNKIGGLLAFATTSGTDNTFLHIVQIIASHKVHGPVCYFINDIPVYPSTLDGSGNVTLDPFLDGDSNPLVRIKFHDGDPDQVADTDLVADAAEWTTAHRLRGHAYVYYRFKFDQEVFGGLPIVQCEFKGKTMIDGRDAGSPNVPVFTNNAALVIQDWLMSDAGLQQGSGDLDLAAFTAAANTCDEIVSGVADVKNNVVIDSVDTTNNLLVLDADACPFVDGDRVQITTSGTLPAGISALTDYYVFVERQFRSNNKEGNVVVRPAISLHTSMEGAVQSLQGAYVDQVNITGAGLGTHTAERNGSTRYTADGLIPYSRKPADVKRDLQSACAGNVIFIGGKWSVVVGAYVAPTIELDEDDLRGPISVSTRVGRSSRFNAVKGTYVSPINNYQPVDYPAFESATFLTDDLDKRLFRDLSLPFTNSPSKATRIAKIALLRHRQEISVTMPCKLSALQVQAGDRISITNAEFGWASKVFDVVDVQLVADASQGVYIGVDLSLQETASTVFDWSAGADESPVDPAPNSTLPSPFTVSVPTGMSLASGDAQTFVRTDGTVFANLKVSWTLHPSSFVQSGGHIEVQYKRSSESEWQDSQSASGDTSFTNILNVETGRAYDVRIRAVSNLGIRSAWTSETNHIVGSKTTQPTGPVSFNVAVDAAGIRRFTWTDTAPPDDLAGYIIRVASGFGVSDWDAMDDVFTGLLTQSPVETNTLSAGNYTFAIRSIDTTGNLSTNVVFVDKTLTDPNLANAFAFIDEKADGWLGTKVNCAIGSNNFLVATSSDAPIGDLPDTIAELPDDINSLGSSFPEFISYTTPEIDLGFDLTFNLLVTLVSNGVETVEMQVGTSADGSADGAGSPSNPWQPVQQATGRYVRLRFNLAVGGSPTFQLIAQEFSYIVDAPITVEDFDDVDTSSATDYWFESLAAGHFRVASRGSLVGITRASLVLQNVGAGWSWELISKTASIASGDVAAEFKVYNASDTLADAVVDVELRGPTT